jgi:hypothetical protein
MHDSNLRQRAKKYYETAIGPALPQGRRQLPYKVTNSLSLIRIKLIYYRAVITDTSSFQIHANAHVDTKALVKSRRSKLKGDREVRFAGHRNTSLLRLLVQFDQKVDVSSKI